ncbi:glycosyltransferase family 2 protein [filamentous cyanobacterium LEGE 11480]|uniref:Glycosyltransferase family 2 protein n=1 Tax=Romeriopsis navalis LEGE 11480 TaxID=2777977 RepID=A0A928VR41_9CYAN|nr:glycosyltransferase family 2 protein [Romeriopsis navalis]MBE9030599.1 glycosyltransferase family 2 protein [Romeriopsis navalis LEGE 11480]
MSKSLLTEQKQKSSLSRTYPSLSVVIPTYNEAADIERIVRGFLNTNYPNLIEVCIADGRSHDRTREIIQNLISEDSRVKLIDNPQKIQSAGLNLALAQSVGEIILRADAHSDYAPDYIERCVEALQQSDAFNVGGAQRFVAKTAFQSGIALATKSFLGSGGAKYRDPSYTGYADTVYLGCFWRDALLQVSGNATVSEETPEFSKPLFDTTQITNQDAELNQRLLDLNPRAIYVSSAIQTWYYPRKTWRSLWKQYFKYGRGRCLTAKKHGNRKQLRGRLPFLALSGFCAMTIASGLLPVLRLPTFGLALLGLCLPVLESVRVVAKHNRAFLAEIWRAMPRHAPSFMMRVLSCSVTLFTLPLAHFSGYAYQLFRQRVLNHRGW